MGIPKYFRYISQRWPVISQLINGSVIPEFDNLYLDMNSILHTCTHRDADEDVTRRMTEQEMFLAIFNYIDHLFSVIKPKKVFYMAIDGVAPRAKMNQQRARRFRSALDAETARKEAVQRGVELPKEEPFDTNSITPGTEFMARLTEQLNYFISRKMSEDARWQNCRVILSGHEVPGEGEHKIMSFIRRLRSDPAYDNNTRHCLYGLDADLIMLGLSTHEPHFALLREEVTFGRSVQFQSAELSEKRFFLLHLSLVREYLQLELSDLERDADFEAILDDFILINFFIGNDFLPELPMLMVNDGAIPVILSTYKEYLEETGEHITNEGVINFKNLKSWMQKLSRYQIERFEAESQNANWFSSQLELLGADVVLNEQQVSVLKALKPAILKGAVDSTPITVPEVKEDSKFAKLLVEQCGVQLTDENQIVPPPVPDNAWLREARKTLRYYEKAPVDTGHGKDVYNAKFDQWRDRYYRAKFHAPHDSPLIKEVVTNYLEGLQWVLSYYYHGCPSWSWFYHFHYAPMTIELIDGISDVDGFEPKFDLSKPFRPFDQLMGVLPDRSKSLIPPAYRWLMTEEASPIRDFYPHTFELDRNGKRAPWEAVVLIPFLDEKRLLSALEPLESQLTDAERSRNTQGTDHEFIYNPQIDFYYPSPGKVAMDIQHCTCKIQPIFPHNLERSKIVYGMLPEARKGTESLAGFPSLYTLDFSFKIEKAGVRVFEQESRDESVVLTIKPREIPEGVEGERIYVGYPFLQEALITKVSPPSQGDKQLQQCERFYDTHGIRIGSTKKVAHYKPLRGLKRLNDGSWVKDWGLEEEVVPLQMIVENVYDEDDRFKERPALPVEQEFPKDSQVLLLLPKGFGSPAVVTEASHGKVSVESLQLKIPESKIGLAMAAKDFERLPYFSIGKVGHLIGLSPLAVSQLTSRWLWMFERNKVDLGICLKKANLNLKALGYARLGQRGWELSTKAVALLTAYLRNFGPVLTALLEIKSHGKIPEIPEKFAETIPAMRKWVKEETAHLAFVPISTQQLSPEAVAEIEKWSVDQSGRKVAATKVAVRSLPPQAVLAPGSAHHLLRRQRFRLGDRVVSALNYGNVPLYSRGTVVGINESAQNTTLDVVFDVEFEAGSYLDKRVTTKRGLTVNAGSVVNLTLRQLAIGSDGLPVDRISAEALPAKPSPYQRISSKVPVKGVHHPPKAPIDNKRFVPAAPTHAWKNDQRSQKPSQGDKGRAGISSRDTKDTHNNGSASSGSTPKPTNSGEKNLLLSQIKGSNKAQSPEKVSNAESAKKPKGSKSSVSVKPKEESRTQKPASRQKKEKEVRLQQKEGQQGNQKQDEKTNDKKESVNDEPKNSGQVSHPEPSLEIPDLPQKPTGSKAGFAQRLLNASF